MIWSAYCYCKRAIMSVGIVGEGFLCSASIVQAACLSPEINNGWGYWRNNCSIWVSVTWSDQNYYASTDEGKFSCSGEVPPRDIVPAYVFGVVEWFECLSPGGQYDVMAIERDYGFVVCMD
jgi:hypothetical protein